jgi:HEAT repeat protein
VAAASALCGWAQKPDSKAKAPDGKTPDSESRAAAPADVAKEAPAPAKPNAPDKSMRSLPPGQRAWEILHAGIAIESAQKRANAIGALGVLRGNREAEKLAIAALKDGSSDVRAAAATALGAMHATSARTPLEIALDDREPAVVLAAANSLLTLKETDFAYDIYYGVLTGSMRTKGNPVKAEMKEQMKILHDKKKIAQLGLEQGIGFIPYGGIGYGVVKTLVKNDNSPMRAAAAKKLAHDPDPVSGEALVAATRDKSPLVRTAALEAIAERGDRSLIPKIVDSMEDDKDEVRFTAAACVVRLSTAAKRQVAAKEVAAAAATGPAAN